MLVYDHLRFDLLLCSKNYAFQAEPWQFPRARLTDAAKIPGVSGVTPLFFAGAKWQEPRGGCPARRRLSAAVHRGVGLRSAAVHQHQSPSRITHIQRLVVLVQHQDSAHQSYLPVRIKNCGIG